jgi:hypothetical protein
LAAGDHGKYGPLLDVILGRRAVLAVLKGS